MENINTSDFGIERRIVYADENGIAYDDPLPELQNTWNTLAQYYAEEAEKSRSSQSSESRLREEVKKGCSACLRSISLGDVVSKGSLKVLSVASRVIPKISLRKYILSEVVKLLKKRKKELLEAFQYEREAEAELKNISQSVTYANGGIQIHLDQWNILQYTHKDNRREYKLRGLTCTIKWKDTVLSGSKVEAPSNYYDNAAEYFYEERAYQSFKRQDLEITIEACHTKEANPLCIAILDELRDGRCLSEMYSDIIVALSRYFFDLLVSEAMSIEIYNGDKKLLCDNRSPTFFAVADQTIIKVARSKDTFFIKRNGKLLHFSSNNN